MNNHERPPESRKGRFFSLFTIQDTQSVAINFGTYAPIVYIIPDVSYTVVERFSNTNNITAVIITIFTFFISVVYISNAQLVSVDPPINVTATVRSIKNIDLSYDSVPDVSGYVIYANGKDIGTTTQLTFTYPYVTFPDKQYCFNVVAYNQNGIYSTHSSESCVSIVRGTTIAATEFVAEKISSNVVKLSWILPITQEQIDAADPIDGYTATFLLERSTDGSVWAFVAQFESASFSLEDIRKTYTDSNARPGIDNSYRLTVFHAPEGFSVSSPTVIVSMGAESSVPSAPINAAVNYSTVLFPDSATLIWKDTAMNETGFVIERKLNGSWGEWKRYDYPNTESFLLSSLSLSNEYTVRIRAVNSIGLSDPSNEVTFSTPAPLNWTPPIPSQHLLIVYNADNPDSVEVKNYYLANRPGISDANVIALHFDPTKLNSCRFSNQSIDNDKFITYIRDPIANWLQANSNKPIRYIVLMYGMPSITLTACNNYSVSYEISRSLQRLGIRDGVEYPALRNTRFTPEYYRGTTALVTFMDMGSIEATKGYIDKLKSVYNQMTNKDVIISAKNAGLGGKTYYFDDRIPYTPYIGREARDAVLGLNPSARVMYRESGYYSTAADVLGYSTWATHGGLAKDFPTNGSVIFSGNSGWYLLRTGESWNGIYDNISTGQSNPSAWFAKTAFGGTSYEYTPVGAVGQIREPSGTGLASKELFTQWERGYLFAEAAWSSRNIDAFIAIGDPLVANTGVVPATTQYDTTAPKIISIYPIGSISSNTTQIQLSVTTDELSTCAYSMDPNRALTESGSITFTTTGKTVHTSVISGLVASSSYRYYVRCRDSHGNVMNSDHVVSFTVSPFVPGPDVREPTVLITYPVNNSIVGNTVSIRVSASDDTAVSGVYFYVDGSVVGHEDKTYPYTQEINLTTGTHTVYALARDAAGNEARSRIITFNVQSPVVENYSSVTLMESNQKNVSTDKIFPYKIPSDDDYQDESISLSEAVKDTIIDNSLIGTKAVRLTFVSWIFSGIYTWIQSVTDFFLDII